jgi:hypothetical protein
MEKGKHRYSYSGISAVEEGKHGREIARQRYGSLDFEKKGAPPPKDASYPQFREDQRGPDWKDDTASDWRRGFGKNGVAFAEGKPNFQAGIRRPGKV